MKNSYAILTFSEYFLKNIAKLNNTVIFFVEIFLKIIIGE